MLQKEWNEWYQETNREERLGRGIGTSPIEKSKTRERLKVQRNFKREARRKRKENHIIWLVYFKSK